MATVYSNLFDAAGVPTKPYRETSPGLFYRKAVYAAPASGDGTAAGDVIQMIPVAKGTTVVDLYLTSEDLDTNAAPTTSLDVGDGDDVDRYIDGSNIATTGGIARLGSGVAAAASDLFPHTYTADDTIDVVVAAAGTTKAAGNVTLVAVLSMENA